MRIAIRVFLLLFLAGCTTSVGPHQYLDQDTAATITVVTSPWMFVADDASSAFDRRGFLSLYAFDVNRMGTHQQYFAVMQSSFDVLLPDAKTSMPILEVQASDRKLTFQSTSQSLQQLGLTQPLEKPITLASRWWYFPVTKQDFTAVAQLPKPRAMLIANEVRFTYAEFRNGSKELAELAATLK